MIRQLLSYCLCICLFVLPHTALAEQAEVVNTFPTIEELVGTNIQHKIGFLWMNHIANGSFSMTRGEEPDTYRAHLIGKTRGTAAWLTSDRMQSYETLMKKLEQGRLITLTHDSTIKRGKGKKKKIRTKHYIFDPVKESITVSKIANGELWWTKDLPFAGDMPVDILTAYFNFVTGIYGPIEPGATYTFPAFGGKTVGQMTIKVLTDEQRPSSSFFPSGGILCQAIVDPEVFDTSNGTIYIWYDDAGNPARGIIQDIIGMGDIRGVMR